MAWYNFWKQEEPKEAPEEVEKALPQTEEKLNPAQPYMGGTAGPSREFTVAYERAYEELEIVNRAVNMIADDVAAIPFNVIGSTPYSSVAKGTRKNTLERLLNYQANAFQDISAFKRNLVLDLILDGNCFIYWDGYELYHLPASKMSIIESRVTYISHYLFQGTVRYEPSEIIHIKDNSFYSIYRGVSRLRPAKRTIDLMRRMRSFQDNFFRNDAVPGLVIYSDSTLNERIKERMMQSWAARYNPTSGGRRPIILDGGLKLDRMNEVNFRDLDFQNSIAENEKIILKALGIPPILLDSGNNANIRPNLRLYYLETIIPIVEKIMKAYERFFGYELAPDITNIPALQPELNEQSDYYTTLVNGGIITPNEAREKLGLERLSDTSLDEIRVPANIAGSAANPSEGGRPPEPEDDK